VKVRVVVQRITCRLHRKDGSEFTLVDAEYLKQRSPSGTE
jgi:hypothetical protein